MKGDTMFDSLLNDLNEEQRRSVECTDGPLLILAGAGSGKTRALTYRVAYIIGQMKAAPFQILAVTFTNKAAREMKDRVVELVGQSGLQVTVSTFHSLCVRILRTECEKVGYQRGFTILDDSDQQMVVKNCLKEFNLSGDMYKPQSMLNAISSAKNELMTPDMYLSTSYDIRKRTIAQVYDLYQSKLRADNSMDFDDLIMLTVKLFQENPEVLAKYQNKFRYIMVDEYQDTNHAQYMLVKLLASSHRNLCVVGDDDQSIYAWRGADIRNILDFENDYPEAVVVKLEQNYRSTSNILDAANKVIACNSGRKEKKLWTECDAGEKIVVYQAESERDEARYIADEIQSLVASNKVSLGDVAVLYRTNAQSRILEEVLLNRGISYKIVGGVRFYERKEIKDVLAYLRFIYNPDDSSSLSRIINVPRRGIGELTMNKVEATAASMGVSLFKAIKAEVESEDSLLSSRAKKVLGDFLHTAEELIELKKDMSVTKLAEQVMLGTGYIAELEAENTIEAAGRIENLKEFLSVTGEFESRNMITPSANAEEQYSDDYLGAFLEEVALIADVDSVEMSEDAVTLMTLHSSKGLEFDVVFIAGMEENIFPSGRSIDDPDSLEEERRLCYVGITRAKKSLYMIYSKFRTIYGSHMMNVPSRFLREIPEELVDFKCANVYGDGGYTRRSQDGQQPSFGVAPNMQQGTGGAAPGFASYRTQPTKVKRVSRFGGQYDAEHVIKKVEPEKAREELCAGDKVVHKVFGEGTVVSVKPSGNDYTVSVAFDSLGVRELAASFAPLKKL